MIELIDTSSKELKVDLLTEEMTKELGLPETQVMSVYTQYHLDSFNLDYDGTISLGRLGPQGYLSLKLKLQRKLMRSFIEVILPSGFLVVVSWVSSQLFINQAIHRIHGKIINVKPLMGSCKGRQRNSCRICLKHQAKYLNHHS